MLYLIDKLKKERIREEIEYKISHHKYLENLFVLTDDNFRLNGKRTFVYDYSKAKGLLISRFVVDGNCKIIIEDWFKIEEYERQFIINFMAKSNIDVYAYIPCFYNDSKKDRRSKYESFQI